MTRRAAGKFLDALAIQLKLTVGQRKFAEVIETPGPEQGNQSHAARLAFPNITTAQSAGERGSSLAKHPKVKVFREAIRQAAAESGFKDAGILRNNIQMETTVMPKSEALLQMSRMAKELEPWETKRGFQGQVKERTYARGRATLALLEHYNSIPTTPPSPNRTLIINILESAQPEARRALAMGILGFTEDDRQPEPVGRES